MKSKHSLKKACETLKPLQKAGNCFSLYTSLSNQRKLRYSKEVNPYSKWENGRSLLDDLDYAILSTIARGIHSRSSDDWLPWAKSVYIVKLSKFNKSIFFNQNNSFTVTEVCRQCNLENR